MPRRTRHCRDAKNTLRCQLSRCPGSFFCVGGVLLELATHGPGFVFEAPDRLGESLVLIGDLESRRKELERRFAPPTRASGLTIRRPIDYRDDGLSASALTSASVFSSVTSSQPFSSEHRRALSRKREIA